MEEKENFAIETILKMVDRKNNCSTVQDIDKNYIDFSEAWRSSRDYDTLVKLNNRNDEKINN